MPNGPKKDKELSSNVHICGMHAVLVHLVRGPQVVVNLSVQALPWHIYHGTTPSVFTTVRSKLARTRAARADLPFSCFEVILFGKRFRDESHVIYRKDKRSTNQDCDQYRFILKAK